MAEVAADIAIIAGAVRDRVPEAGALRRTPDATIDASGVRFAAEAVVEVEVDLHLLTTEKLRGCNLALDPVRIADNEQAAMP